MSKCLPVNTNDGKVQYEIEITTDFNDLAAQLKKLGYQPEQKFCIISDSNVASYYLNHVIQALNVSFPLVFSWIFPAGEENKNVETVNRGYQYLIENHFDRQDVLLALGGGVVGDLTGFLAATYLRGIDFIQVPTTLLSQVDSSIGGKTGVDFMQYKNMVGAFYSPRLVYMNLCTLHTLPQIQLTSGFGEILKHGLIKDDSYFSWMLANQQSIMTLSPEETEKMIYESCDIKRGVVERDPKEQGERALLNFGHTIGHAIEKLSNFSLYHGECVGLGMVAAAYISCQQGNITPDQLQMIENTLEQFGLKTRVSGFDAMEVLDATKSDKKRVGKSVKFILLRKIGEAYVERGLLEEEILDGIRYVCQ